MPPLDDSVQSSVCPGPESVSFYCTDGLAILKLFYFSGACPSRAQGFYFYLVSCRRLTFATLSLRHE